MELSEDRKLILATTGHILVLGGPGSGKTTIALHKAKVDFEAQRVSEGRKILFLSFARSTIARVEENAGGILTKEARKAVEINTYHGFIWSILRSHGYLLGPDRQIQLLPPPEAAARLSEFKDKEERRNERRRLFKEDGLIHFDEFAFLCSELLTKSTALRSIISSAYPIIILDEFQDTNDDEWALIQQLGQNSEIITLADPDQRIYEFRGADPKRIGDFIGHFGPTQFDFGMENNRSNGTDIVQFSNDILTGVNKGKVYGDVCIEGYSFRKGNAQHIDLKSKVLSRRSHLLKCSPDNWSLAVLVPSKALMLQISSYLSEQQSFQGGSGLPEIQHEVAIETAGPALAAKIIGSILEMEGRPPEEIFYVITNGLVEYLRGRRGDKGPTQADQKLANVLSAHISEGKKIIGKNRTALVESIMTIAVYRHLTVLTGDPGPDWLTIRNLIKDHGVRELCDLVEHARYLRLLHKGARLTSSLAKLWREHGSYRGAKATVQESLLQEHFSNTTQEVSGIHVMTMHKSKGKQFTETIIYEGSFQGKFVRDPEDENVVAQSRLLMRVAATRAEQRVHILTPSRNPSPLFV